ncbi:MAG: phosphotransferase family protein [Actinomycetia bacterium]|nr:phosphotransferase family protein [Actinomycetes bacterium]
MEGDEKLIAGLQSYLSSQIGVPVVVTGVGRPEATGFSAETMIVSVGAASLPERLVVQAAPQGPALFAHYDLSRTFRTQRVLGSYDVPVAPMRWLCLDESWIGAPFYVMDHVIGRVSPDRPPYHGGGWLFDEPVEVRQEIWFSGIEAMAALHRVPVDDFVFLAEGDQTDAGAQRLDRWRTFGLELGDDRSVAVLDALDELGANRPDPGDLRVHWGDAKLGNMVFAGNQVAAILDWELCGLSVGEEDLAHWMAVDWFLSTGLGGPRLEGLPGPDETIARYEAVVGRAALGVDWWFAFALLRMGLIFQRAAVQARLRKGGSGPLRANLIEPRVDGLVDGSIWARYRASAPTVRRGADG